jgi:hypothetical protein
MAASHWRYLWNPAGKYEPAWRWIGLPMRYELYWDIIRHDSFVVITAAEARIGARVPSRFMGLARPIIVGNIAAQDGYVEFCLFWSGEYSPFPIWTDITVFDRNDPSGASGQ